MKPIRLEIALKEELFDPAGASLVRRAADYLDLSLDSARRIDILTFDLPLTREEAEEIRREIFTNPVTQISSFEPLARDFDWLIWVGLRPGVKDNPGDTAKEAVESHYGRRFGEDDKVFASTIYALKAPALSREGADKICSELLANPLIQRWRVFSPADWDPAQGIGVEVPRVELATRPTFEELDFPDDAAMLAFSEARSLALFPADVPVIRAYFNRPGAAEERAAQGLSAKPTDVELEFISQARSDHCNHNTFRGIFRYREAPGAAVETIDDLFATCIKEPTLAIQSGKDWVVSVLWDNAGVAALDKDWLYTVTGETHNSPSNMEAYGGAITGIVGVYRDPLGTGLGSKLFLGTYGYCVGPLDYDGPLTPRLHPRRLLSGVIEGVRDGGNKSGVPTGFGLVHFDPRYLGKCLVYVTALGVMPRIAGGKETWKKAPHPGDLCIMAGGRVGKDGIHGVTASSEGYSDKTPAGHVQIGDPYTQKKMMDFLLEARDEGLMSFVTDNGGGGLSSSIGESARMSGGAEVWLDKVPLKYPGLELWEIWVSESQERMTIALPPDNEARFFELAAKHAVEATVVGRYTDTGKLHLKHGQTTCAYVDVDFTDKGFPQWEFEAQWLSPQSRGLSEPVISDPAPIEGWAGLLTDLLAHPNLAAKNWILRQYDHEVQGGSVIKPLCGVERDVPADASVYRPVLTSEAGLALSQCLNPSYGDIDTYHMTAATIDEAVRRLVAVGADPDRIGAVDNFCWPTIIYDPVSNPDGKYKAAQLVRSARALKDVCLAFGVPLLSGKDSMYVDGMLAGPYGERRKISGPPSLQVTATGVLPDFTSAVTLEPKAAGDLVYLVGQSFDELGGSALYDLLGQTGLNVPVLRVETAKQLYARFHRAIRAGQVRSAKALTRGGLAVAAALACFASGKGLDLDLAAMTDDTKVSLLARAFGESCSRLLVTVAPDDQAAFEETLGESHFTVIGMVSAQPKLVLRSHGNILLDVDTARLKQAWLKPFGGLI